MKKLIVLFLVVCSCGIYFLGSGCGMEDTAPDDLSCVGSPLPIVDFTTAKTEYFVGETVTFTFTGTMNSKDGHSWRWDFDYGGNPNLFPFDYVKKKHMNPVIKYDKAGTYSVQCIAHNGCWADGKRKVNYITIKAK